MSKSKTISIAFDTIGRIPAGILKDGKPAIVDPHKAIDVPRIYGEHLIENHLAYDPDERARANEKNAEQQETRSARAGKDKGQMKQVSELEAQLADVTKKLEDQIGVSGGLSKDLKAAEETVALLQKQIAQTATPATEAKPAAEARPGTGTE
ncbi:MAG: hypothetical protein P1V21_01235 [Rhizobiaceae bacterium]|nr:hypothetical protein [Rhizobiaceae bacterium]